MQGRQTIAKRKKYQSASMWPTQIWWPQLLRILIEHPVAFPQQKNLLSLPNSNKVHHLQKRMVMMACYISGDHRRQGEFQNKPSRSSWRPGALGSGKSIYFISKMGRLLCAKKNQSKSFNCRAGFAVPHLSLRATVGLSCSASNTDRVVFYIFRGTQRPICCKMYYYIPVNENKCY